MSEKIMKYAKKAIKRATKESAHKAMQAHIDSMKAKGWSVHAEFQGDAGCKFEFITEFYK
jgi:hypothetical protein